MISIALVKNMREKFTNIDQYEPILKLLDLPDTVKQDLKNNLKRYLQAVNLSGIEKNTIRKMMVVGNTGTLSIVKIIYRKQVKL